MADLKIHKCGDCGMRIVIMDTQTGSILPVEVESGKIYTDDDVFDFRIHRSHLIKCQTLRMRWKDFQIKYFKRIEAKYALTLKDLTR